MKWVAAELHSHTVHSDGAFSPDDLAEAAAEAGFQAVALTDHNTDSGRDPFALAARARGLVSIPGLELTTFFGHVLVWGKAPSVDWRVLGPSDLGPALATLAHRNDLVIGAAHPFRPGNPFCTGCYWEYDLPFDDLDALEVWSGLDPDLSPDNARALALWDQLLDQGTRITATAGRDWHRAGGSGLRSATFLGVPEGPVKPDDLVRALGAGRACLSLGPWPQLSWGPFAIGDRVDPSAHQPGVAVTFGAVDSGWGLALDRVEGVEVRLVSNLGVLARHDLGIGGSFALATDERSTDWRWLRVEVRGRYEGRDRVLALGNPIYGSGSLGKATGDW